MWLLIAFIAVPLIEIGLFIQVGGWIGLFPTLAIVLVTAVLGTWLVRTQGAMALGQLRASFSNLNDPTEPLVHGAMILFAGALLLTPGFFTDAVGFALLVPAFRHAAFKALRARVKVHSFGTPGPGHPTAEGHATQRGDVIDAEFYEVDENNTRQEGPSGWTKH
ncbi:FxsA family protein [Sulfitobacter sp. F26204]|uniref:FxsA family protein n=1 Tax=Sulfitobacter sp. F26204 TaxID=2996014 RepID=UPI00225E5BE1|nr:FxsA family protein [Sulfitobacter sp. F26204]MCX7558240.1 FxsA family protein [Sulfitobacter sp. F26204]